MIDTDISSCSCLFTNVLDLISLIMQVFKTASKGWGVRTWDTILPGAPICEYTGVLRRTDDLDGLQNNYCFDIDCLQTMKGLDGREVINGFIMYSNMKYCLVLCARLSKLQLVRFVQAVEFLE